MEMIYNNLDMKLLIPDSWSLLSESEIARMGLKSQNEVELLDAFSRTDNENNVISFQDYGDVAGFIEELNSYIDDLKDEIFAYKKSGGNWKEKYPVNPIANSIKMINDKRTYLVIYETANIDTLVLQIYFLFKKHIYCLSSNIKNTSTHIDTLAEENRVALECFEVIKSVSNAK